MLLFQAVHSPEVPLVGLLERVSYDGNDLLHLNPKGVVPDVAIIKRGEKRTNPFREKKQFEATTFPAGVDVGKLMAEEEEKDAYVRWGRGGWEVE